MRHFLPLLLIAVVGYFLIRFADRDTLSRVFNAVAKHGFWILLIVITLLLTLIAAVSFINVK